MGAEGEEVGPQAVEVDVDPAEVELVADRLFALGATAVSEEPRTPAGPVTLTAELDLEAIAALRRDGLAVRRVEVTTGWLDAWREHATVLRCGERLVVRPAWLPSPRLGPRDVEVVMEPGHAFGSGTHATTRLCLAAVERLVRPGDRVLDVGSGTGVLGVAAALLGAAQVDAIDVDPEAVRATRHLAELNAVAEVVSATGAPGDRRHDRYDLVLANLLLPTIRDLAGELVARTAEGGTLVVSGFLEHQLGEVLQRTAALRVARTERADGWVAVELRHRREPPGRHG